MPASADQLQATLAAVLEGHGETEVAGISEGRGDYFKQGIRVASLEAYRAFRHAIAALPPTDDEGAGPKDQTTSAKSLAILAWRCEDEAPTPRTKPTGAPRATSMHAARG